MGNYLEFLVFNLKLSALMKSAFLSLSRSSSRGKWSFPLTATWVRIYKSVSDKQEWIRTVIVFCLDPSAIDTVLLLLKEEQKRLSGWTSIVKMIHIQPSGPVRILKKTLVPRIAIITYECWTAIIPLTALQDSLLNRTSQFHKSVKKNWKVPKWSSKKFSLWNGDKKLQV